MSNDYNKLIFADIECSCNDKWSKKEFYEKSELTEIGLTLYDNTNDKILDNRSIYFKVNNKLSDFCVDLTGITDKLLEKQGKKLEDGLNEIKNHYPFSKPWFTWGYFDLKYLLGYFDKRNLIFPFKAHKHINLKLLYDSINCNKKGSGLRKACNKLNIEFDDNKHHSGRYDSLMTCEIYRRLFK